MNKSVLDKTKEQSEAQKEDEKEDESEAQSEEGQSEGKTITGRKRKASNETTNDASPAKTMKLEEIK